MVEYINDNQTLEKINIVGGKRWRKLRTRKKIGTGIKFLNLYGGKQTFNIYNSEELVRLLEALEIGAIKLGWNTTGNPLLKERLDEIEKLKNEKGIYREKLNELYKDLLKIKQEKLKADISIFEEDLNNFKHLIDEESTKEEDIQLFLEQHPWLIGFEYLESQPRRTSQFELYDSRFDFFLQRFDTNYDIVELKKPNAKLFVGSGDTETTSRSVPQASDLAHAISQTIRYLDLVLSKREQLRAQGIDIMYPRAVIIIGRTKNNIDKKRLNSLVSYLHGIEIRSYDDIIDKAKTVIDHLINKPEYT